MIVASTRDPLQQVDSPQAIKGRQNKHALSPAWPSYHSIFVAFNIRQLAANYRKNIHLPI
jgi:hypothetical protein